MFDYNNLHTFYNNEVVCSKIGSVLTIKINAPERMNTMGIHVNSGVTQALNMASDDPSIAVVVFTGSGDRAFSAGGNLDGGGASAGMRQKGGENSPPPTVNGAIMNLRNMMKSSQLLRDSHFVSIAAVNGACAGAALSWACACDIRIGAENVIFRTGFLTAGLSGDFGGTWLLPRIVGPAKAREMYLMNEKIRGEEAKRIGLISKLIPLRGKEFQREVQHIAQNIASAPPLALKRIKANLVDADRLSFAEHLDVEAERHAKSGFHPDAREAGESFLMKRKPKFKGLPERESWEASKL
jgi:2-(1,2-epoxy-1,2-dihydrophenyl)acetyl-CoA isomerase